MIFKLSLIGVGIYLIWLLILIVAGRRRTAPINTTKLPANLQLWLIVPALNEATVIRETLTRFLTTTRDLPMIKLMVVDDGSNDGTGAIVQAVIHEAPTDKIYLTTRVLPAAQTGKGDALNWAYQRLVKLTAGNPQSVVVGVIDADAYMTKAGYLRVLNEFANQPQLGLLQVAVKIMTPQNWLQRLQDIEFMVVNDWIQNVRNRLGNAAASGNGQFVRMQAVTSSQPWGNALLEDFEFSTRCLLAGHVTKYVGDVLVYQEALSKVRPFIRQRTRWAQGGLDCLVTYWPRILRSSQLTWGAKFEMTFYMYLPMITLVTGFANLYVLAYVLCHVQSDWPILALLLVINLWIDLYLIWKYTLRNDSSQRIRLIRTILALACYHYLLYPVTVLAIWKKLRGQTQWIKTVHGEGKS